MKNKKKDNFLPYYLGFSYFLGIGPMRLQSLIKYFGDAKSAYEGNQNKIIQIIGKNLGDKFCQFRKTFDKDKKLEELIKKNIKVICLENSRYPDQLSNISDPPICLYVRGNAALLKSEYIFAIVGTRRPTNYGFQIAVKFAQELSEMGFIIISGMALGIDSAAHKAVLNKNKLTIAVLGCGVDIIYPAVNRYLYSLIIEKGGCVISEFPPEKFVEKGLFIARNRIISGLSKGILVVEGQKNSGALITARHAAEQGKEVFAPPSPITSSMSEAPNNLLKQGAKIVTSVEDIIEGLGLKIVPQKKEEIGSKLSENENDIFKALQENPLTINEIVNRIQKTTPEILNTLSLMELKGVIEKNSERKYQIRL